MTNWAVLIGINQYWEPARSLKGAVNDAMRMLQWFLNAKECHVPAENIFLLTRPRPDEIPPGVTYRDAIADELLQLIPDVGDIGDKPDVGRLFFHFSGHGITNFEGGGDEQCLVMADFTPKLTNKALKFNAIKDFFKKTGFREQFFFIDACRNLLPWPYEFETGSTTIKRKGNIKQHTVDQFILNSTAPHSKAWEGLLNPTDKPGEEQGAFTGALLDGLNGDGTAKIYDSNDNEYLVKKESLFDYVISKVDARNIYVVKDPVHPVKQHPLKDGEHSKNPLLVKIPVESVKPERLELFVAPDEVWPIAELRISDENQEFEEVFRPPVKGVPLPLPPLQPMRYTLHASAPNHILEGKNPKRRSFAFYESMEMSVRLIPVQPPSPPAPDASFSAGATSAGFDESIDPPSIDEGPTLVVDLESERLSAEPLGGPSQFAPTDSYTVTQSMLHTKFAELVVEADDRFASLEIRDSAGTLLSLGQGCWKSSALKPGFYHVRVVAPEGQYVEEVIELVAGEKETISIEAPEPSPSRLMEEIIEKAGIQEKKTKNILEVSKAASPISSGQPSTILALAAVAANQNAGWGSRLRNLGVKSFSKVADSERSAGLQIIAGAESLREPLSSVRMRLWPREANISEDTNELTLLPAVAGLAEYTGLSKSGAHWLSIEVPGQVSAVFSVYLPPHMMTLLPEFFFIDINNWYLAPLLQTAGTIREITSLKIVDSFGVTTEIGPSASAGDPEWAMFALAPSTASSPNDGGGSV